MLLGESRPNRGQIGARVLERRTGAEAADDVEIVGPALSSEVVLAEGEAAPSTPSPWQVVKPPRHHANDRIGHIVETHAATED